MIGTRSRGRWSGAALASFLAVGLLGLGGCDSPLDVQDPDIVPPEELLTPEGLNARRLGAFGDFALSYSGAPIGGGGTEGIILAGGLLADENIHSGTFPSRVEFDSRDVRVQNPTLEVFYSSLHRARRAAEATAADYEASEEVEQDTKTEARAELMNLAGYTYVFFAENFCSGVPFSEVTDAGELVFGSPQTTTEILNTAIQRFDAALSAAGAAGSDALENVAKVGKARAQLGLGQFDAAATTAADVPTDFVFLIRHSMNSAAQENGVHTMHQQVERWSVVNNEGNNGLDYLEAFTAGDPRTPWERNPPEDVGFDTSVPQFDQLKYPARDSDVPLATGIEARLIEAEAALQTGAVGDFEQIHNDLRATVGLDAVDAGAMSETEMEDFHFRERGFWLWLQGHRLSDLRRLIRQYGRAEDDVFPTGDYFKPQAGEYGDDVNYPIPFDEENNPNFEECINRDA